MIQTILSAFTGTGKSVGVRMPLDDITLFLILAYGATPTISLQLEGSGESGMEQGSWQPPADASYIGIPTIDASDAANTPTTNAVSHTYTTGSPIVLKIGRAHV